MPHARTCRIVASLVLTACVSQASAAEPPASPFADHPVNRWVKQSPRDAAPVPKFGWEGSGAYDPFNKRWIHHAGHDGNPQGFVTFTCDPATGVWRQMFPPTSPPGVCCVDGGNVFDAANRAFVRFPGGSLGHGYQWSRGVKLKDSAIWLYDPAKNEWQNMRPPPYADNSRTRDAVGGLNPSAAYDPVNQLAITFGGQGSVGGKNNLHAYDAWSNTLHQLKPAHKNDPWPEARDGSGLAYDAKHEKLVLFGSQYSNDERTWVYDFRANKWTAHDLTPHPPARKDKNTYATIPKMTFDPVNNVVLCVVWLDEQRGHETWALDLEKMAWTNTNAEAQAENSKSRARNLDFSAADNVAIMETWSVKNEPQLWTYRYRPFSRDTKGSAPPPALTVTTTEKSAQLSWTPVQGATAYCVERAAAGDPWNLSFAKLAEVTGTTYEDATATAGQIYTYTVRPIPADAAPASLRARTQPRVPVAPTVSVLAKDKIQIAWPAHPAAADVAGYNLYRGKVSPRTVLKGTPGAWKDNDPQYEQSVVTGVNDITDLVKLNGDKTLTTTTFDDVVDLTQTPPADYRYAVYAYILRAVNHLGVESGPSPYALTIPTEPTNVLCRESGAEAQLKWSPSPEKNLLGYHVYKLQGGVFGIARVTDAPIKATTFTHTAGKDTTRYWVVAVDALGQEGQPSSPAWFGKSYKGFFDGEWHQ
jgi:hypothetical protein